MAFNLFSKNKTPIQDKLFLKITWEDDQNPVVFPELSDMIEYLDQEVLRDNPFRMMDTLPYLTFLQAEVLFSYLKANSTNFRLKKLAICHKEAGEAVSDGEAFISPLVVDSNFQNVLEPLIQGILTEPAFENYTYQEKREYFTDEVFPAYKESLDVTDAALPLFPAETEVRSLPIKQTVNQESSKNYSKLASQEKIKSIYLLGGLILTALIATFSLVFGVLLAGKLAEKTEQVEYLYDQVVQLQNLQQQTGKVDVFGRYFLPNYYSGNKDLLKPFLDKEDGKFTAAKNGTLQSVILESVTEKEKHLQVSYVLVVKEEEVPKSFRLELTLKKDKKAKYGYLLTEEPKVTETNYLEQIEQN